MGELKKTSDIKIQKLLYFGIFASIVFLNLIIFFLVGAFSTSIPTGELDILLFTAGGVLLMSSLVIPMVLMRRSDDYQTIQLITWACLEGVATIGFIHSYMGKENVMLFYCIPALFQMYKSYPKLDS